MLVARTAHQVAGLRSREVIKRISKTAWPTATPSSPCPLAGSDSPHKVFQHPDHSCVAQSIQGSCRFVSTGPCNCNVATRGQWKLQLNTKLHSAEWSLTSALAKETPTVTLHLLLKTGTQPALVQHVPDAVSVVSCRTGGDWH